MADTSLVGRVAAEMMEWLEDNHDEDNTVVTVMVAVEVQRGDGATQIGYRSSDKREWVQRAFITEVLRVCESEDVIEQEEGE